MATDCTKMMSIYIYKTTKAGVVNITVKRVCGHSQKDQILGFKTDCRLM